MWLLELFVLVWIAMENNLCENTLISHMTIIEWKDEEEIEEKNKCFCFEFEELGSWSIYWKGRRATRQFRNCSKPELSKWKWVFSFKLSFYEFILNQESHFCRNKLRIWFLTRIRPSRLFQKLNKNWFLNSN